MRFDSLTTFLIILIVFVAIVILMQWFSTKRETFVSFNQESDIGTLTHIPQYSKTDTKTVVSLYDSLYFDYQNGTVINVVAPASSKNTPNDVTGSTITSISMVTRDNAEVSSRTSQQASGDAGSPQSLVKSVSPLYNHFSYSALNSTTDPYQLFYTSWNTQTYIHLVDLSASNPSGNACGSNLYTYVLGENGLISSVSGTEQHMIPLPAYTSATNYVSAAISHSYSKPYYLDGAKLYKIAYCAFPETAPAQYAVASGSPSGSNKKNVSYDIATGNIVIDDGQTLQKVYNRASGNTVITEPSSSAIGSMKNLSSFIISDFYPFAAIHVIAYKKNTVINIITPSTAGYNFMSSTRFNETTVVVDLDSEKPPVATTQPTTTTSPVPSTAPCDKNSFDKNYDTSGGISPVCGDDISCKWYWFFNSIGQKNNNNMQTEDYILKTEVVPPVCPQCPMCPDSGVCSNCGGQGGSGACSSTNKPALTPSPTVPGTFTDGSGNVFVLYTDKTGNKSYVPLSSVTQQGATASVAPFGGAGAGAGAFTGADASGKFVTTADPNTLGGGLAVTTMSMDQLGSNLFNNTGSVANNVASGAGSLANKVVDTAGNVVTGAENIIGGTIGAASGLVGGTINTAANLAQGAGKGFMQLASSSPSAVGSVASGASGASVAGGAGAVAGGAGSVAGSVAGPPGAVSDKTFGNMKGQTPVDNYSQYGALQSKGANYMPVTADFSAFRK